MYIDYLICYGRGIPSIAKQLGTTEQEAQNIYNSVLDIFKGLKKFDEDSKRMAFEKGYVTTAYGRRRRLPDIRLPEYSISYTAEHMARAEQAEKAGTQKLPTEITPEIADYWAKQLESIKYRSDYRRIKDTAYAQGINIVSNQAFKARAARQTVNARIQGSASDMTKIAMAKIAKDEKLKELGFRMLIQVHDEIIGECPVENAEAAAERFCYIMAHCVEDKIDLPFNTDATIETYWYSGEVKSEASDDLDDYLDEFEEDEE